MKNISELARAINADWSDVGRTPSEMPSIAARHLVGGLGFGLPEVIDMISKASNLPSQRRADQAFGQPGVTLFSSTDFEIEALFWRNATPAIHQHSFAGAFCHLAGRSVHCTYAFEPEDALGGVTTGQLTRQRLDILRPGQAIEIPMGAELIHSVFHVDNPSVTLVVRTHQEQMPEMTYLPPGLSYDTSGRTLALHKKLQLLDTLSMTSHPDYPSVASAMLEQGGLFEAFSILIRLGGHDGNTTVFDDASRMLSRRFEGFSGIETVLAAAQEERHRCRLVARRLAMTEAEDRILLALLLGCENAQSLLASATEISGGHEAAINQLAVSAARLIGGDENRQTAIRAAVLTRLEGGSADAFLRVIETLHGQTIDGPQSDNLRRLYANVMADSLLAPMFREPIAGAGGER